MTSQLKYYQITKPIKTKIELPRSNLSFRSNSSLKSYTTLLIKKVLDIEIQNEHEDYPFFCDMIDRHYEIKYEDGMRFIVHTNNGYNLDEKRSKERTPYRRAEPYRAYVYIPSIRKYCSFSLLNKCVNGKNYSDRELKIREYRKVIEPQIQIQRRIKKWECEMCKSTKMLDIDHYPKSFNHIVKEFEKTDSEGTIELFEKFHNNFAQYRILCKDCHIKHGLKK